MSIIPLPSDGWPLSYPSLFCICTALLSPLFFCHPLFACLYLPFYLHLSVYLYIIFCSIPLSFFQPLSFIMLFQLICLPCTSLSTLDLSFPPVLLIHSKPSSHLLLPSVFSLPFCRRYLWHHSHYAIPALSSHHLSLPFVCFWKCSGRLQTVQGHLLADLTGL